MYLVSYSSVEYRYGTVLYLDENLSLQYLKVGDVVRRECLLSVEVQQISDKPVSCDVAGAGWLGA